MSNIINKVAIFGATGNFGASITQALQGASFDITIITRPESTSDFPPNIPVVRTPYDVPSLTKVLSDHDAAISVVGPAGVGHQVAMIEAAEAAGVKRFILNDFGWGPSVRGLPEFDAVHAQRKVGWNRAAELAEGNAGFTWTGISTGNPIDWALRKFPLMGFNVVDHTAIIYDSGSERFSGCTLEGIAQSVVGVLRHPEETANRFVRALNIITCQNELLEAFQSASRSKWVVKQSTTTELLEAGRRKLADGTGGWVLHLAVAQLLEEGKARCLVAPTREESDAELLGMVHETTENIAKQVLGHSL